MVVLPVILCTKLLDTVQFKNSFGFIIVIVCTFVWDFGLTMQLRI